MACKALGQVSWEGAIQEVQTLQAACLVLLPIVDGIAHLGLGLYGATRTVPAVPGPLLYHPTNHLTHVSA